MSSLVDFLAARVAEDEAAARNATPGPWEADAMDSGHSRYEMDAWVTAGEGDTICDMDGLNRSRNEVVAQDDGYKDAQHVARHDPARVLAECKAKRWILGSLKSTADAHANETHLGQKLVLAGMDTGLRMALKALAGPYRDHPDFDEDWALDE